MTGKKEHNHLYLKEFRLVWICELCGCVEGNELDMKIHLESTHVITHEQLDKFAY